MLKIKVKKIYGFDISDDNVYVVGFVRADGLTKAVVLDNGKLRDYDLEDLELEVL